MRQAGTFRPEARKPAGGARPAWWSRLLAPVLFFAVAFTVDMLTGQRYSPVLGSVAIVASAIALFASIVPGLVALGAYAGTWAGFNIARAFADDAGLALGSATLIAEAEGAVKGTLPPIARQDAFFDASSIGAHDVALSIVHGSFFMVPFAMAAVVWWRRRDLMGQYTVATAATFALGLVGFLLLPTAPPWMAAPDEVTRVTHHLLASRTGFAFRDGDGGFAFEPNHLAAMPSVHVAATVLVFLAARGFGRVAGWAGGAYAVAMSVAVVYLGEHYVLDAVGGWAIALGGWALARRFRAA
jgi:membrane-associated phospholipid phosphatase